MTPIDPVTPRPGQRDAIFGAPDPKRGPLFFFTLSSIYTTKHGYPCLPQDVLNRCFLEPRSIVFELQQIPLLVEAEALQPVCVGKLG